eukprot:TsM_000385500 transcript=TsM_000385500 gene=TsM_000385500
MTCQCNVTMLSNRKAILQALISPYRLAKSCAICNSDTPAGKGWCLDHVHRNSPASCDLLHVQHCRRFINPVSRCPRDVHQSEPALNEIFDTFNCNPSFRYFHANDRWEYLVLSEGLLGSFRFPWK